MSAGLREHLRSGHTTLCRCWRIVRADGVTLGFTDHDLPLAFDGVTFAPESGLTAAALAQSTGLSIDNSEALGALRSDAISETDLIAGRYDGAEVTAWLVNWQAPEERAVQFRGHVGEVTRGAGAFTAELRGLAERLNQPQRRVYQRQCTAVLGDGACGVDLQAPGRSAEVIVTEVSGAHDLRFSDPGDIEAGALVRGTLRVLDGATAGLLALIKADEVQGGARHLTLWQSLQAELVPGDRVAVSVGCDKSAETCRARFDNLLNFRGFPHVPGEDWLMSYPVSGAGNDGGSLFGGGQ